MKIGFIGAGKMGYTLGKHLKACATSMCEIVGYYSQNIESAINGDLPIDMIEIDVKELWETLGEITGEVYKDELLDEIFSKFCLGK